MVPSKPGFENTTGLNQSFYTKQGLDFLYFARPGTAYGPQSFMKSGMGTTTMAGFYQSDKKTVKPIEMIKSKNQSSSLLT
jgi:hypothetical protein